ncbi:MAG: DUF6754 domain-containing protein [Candidatus Marinimicrobia bacterium]|nr:DUF6754 domain-containing protein [Candidatus Neomarinimicrobiota bacterium]
MIVKRTVLVLVLLIGLSGPAFAELGIVAQAEPADVDGNIVNITITPAEGASIYLIHKSLETGEWVPVTETVKLNLNTNIESDIPTKFRVTALDKDRRIIGIAESGTVITRARWFNINRTNRFVALLMISGIILFYIARARKNKEIYLRPVAGLQAFEEAVGRATEMGRSVLYVPGIMDLDQVETISGLIILGHVAKMTARYETDLNVPVSRSLVMESGRRRCGHPISVKAARIFLPRTWSITIPMTSSPLPPPWTV